MRLYAYVKEGYGDRDVIDHALFTCPPIHGLFHQKVDGAIRIFLLIETVDDAHHYFVVCEAVPQAI